MGCAQVTGDVEDGEREQTRAGALIGSTRIIFANFVAYVGNPEAADARPGLGPEHLSSRVIWTPALAQSREGVCLSGGSASALVFCILCVSGLAAPVDGAAKFQVRCCRITSIARLLPRKRNDVICSVFLPAAVRDG